MKKTDQSTTASVERRTVLAGLAALTVPTSTGAQAATRGDYPALQKLIDYYVVERRVPGAVVAVRRGRRAQPIYLNAGTLAFDTPAPAGPNSIFRIYSMTKPVTGLAIMKLIEEGKLKLDQPVSDILPEFKNQRVMVGASVEETRPAKRPTTIRHLLTHSSGLIYNFVGGPLGDLYTSHGIAPGLRQVGRLQPNAEFEAARDLETLGKRLAELPLAFEPGTRWQYSVATDLLGLVVQRVSGKDFHAYLQDSFFGPLRMVDTDFIVPASKLDRFTSVMFYADGKANVSDDRKSSPFARDRDLPSGGGGLVSTAIDYSRFTAMLLNEGELDGARVVKRDTIRTMRSNLLEPGVRYDTSPSSPTIKLPQANGFGAAVSVVIPGGARPGMEPVGSYGWWGAASTQMWVDPVNDLTVVLLVQYRPERTFPLAAEVRTAAYQDLSRRPA